MDETDAWTAFLQTGSVLDYLTYATIKNEGKQPGAGIAQEAAHENFDGWSDTQGTEYRGAE